MTSRTSRASGTAPVSASAPTAARRSTGKDGGLMATTEYVPRLKVQYNEELRGRLKDELGKSTVMDVPKIEKITLNMGVGEAKTESKALDAAMDELTIIAGQRAQLR